MAHERVCGPGVPFFLLAVVLGASRVSEASSASATSQANRQRRCPDMVAGEQLLSKLLGNLTVSDFLQNHWTTAPLYVPDPGQGEEYGFVGHPTTWWQLDNLSDTLSVNSTSPHRLRPGQGIEMQSGMINLARTTPGVGRDDALSGLPWLRRTSAGIVTDQVISKLAGAVEDGWTLVLNKAYTLWRPLLQVASLLEQYFEVPTSGNLFITPPRSKGFSLHFDNTDVFFVQLAGVKRWRVYAPILEAPMKANHPELEKSAKLRRTPLLDVYLRPGDVMYVPRGFLHEGEVPADSPTASVHYSISPEPATWAEYLHTMPLSRLAGLPRVGPGVGRVEGEEVLKAWQKKNSRGLALGLRRHMPPRLSRYCGGPRYREDVLDILATMDPAVARGTVAARLGGKLPASTFVAMCKDFLAATLAPSFVSLHTTEAEVPEGFTADSDTPRVMCLTAPMAARLHRGPPGATAELHVSTLNGPGARMEREAAEPWEVDPAAEAWAEEQLHTENNPTGVVHIPAGNRAIAELVRRLVQARALTAAKPSSPGDTLAAAAGGGPGPHGTGADATALRSDPSSRRQEL